MHDYYNIALDGYVTDHNCNSSLANIYNRNFCFAVYLRESPINIARSIFGHSPTLISFWAPYTRIQIWTLDHLLKGFEPIATQTNHLLVLLFFFWGPKGLEVQFFGQGNSTKQGQKAQRRTRQQQAQACRIEYEKWAGSSGLEVVFFFWSMDWKLLNGWIWKMDSSLVCVIVVG